MKPEDNTRMYQLACDKNLSDKSMKKYQDFILNHIEKFDDMEWDWICSSFDFTVNGMKKYIEFWESVYSKIKNLDASNLNDISKMIIKKISINYEELIKE